MTSNGIFLLRWTGVSESVEYYFTGPEGLTQGDFQRLCDRLMGRAAFNAVETTAKREFVGWGTLVERLAYLLETEGFARFEPTTVRYAGPQIIMGRFDNQLADDAHERIEGHNQQVMAQMTTWSAD